MVDNNVLRHFDLLNFLLLLDAIPNLFFVRAGVSLEKWVLAMVVWLSRVWLGRGRFDLFVSHRKLTLY